MEDRFSNDKQKWVYVRPKNQTPFIKIVQNNEKRKVYRFFKRLFDILMSVLALLVLWPVFLLIALCIKIEDGGKVFYVHERLGWHGKKIKIYKFRSMRPDSEKLEDVLSEEQLEFYKLEFKIDDDPRVTKVGKFLRKISLDELPQFFNVIKGDLSIVGPRPIVEEELERYGKAKDFLLSVKPGLTGYWQAYARNDVKYENGKRQAMEIFYCENQGICLDFKIILKTFVAIIKKTGV
ncbi:MAG: sugar transferase [bacterium]|nr:sugar transferase [bacterium]